MPWWTAPPSTVLDRPSSTAWEAEAANDGFCHVGSRPPNAESATPPGAGARARWIGGSAVQAGATAAGMAGAADGEPSGPPSALPVTPAVSTVPAARASVTAPPVVAPRGVEPRLRARSRGSSRSRNPTAQPSAPARVTKDAMASV